MKTTLSQARTTGPFKGRYYIRAQAWWSKPLAGMPFVRGRGEVFDGEPLADSGNSIFKTGAEVTLDDLLAVLENVERICRDHVQKLN